MSPAEDAMDFHGNYERTIQSIETGEFAQFNQSSWLDARTSGCSTYACIAGHAWLANNRFVFEGDEYYREGEDGGRSGQPVREEDITASAQVLLNLGDGAAEALFSQNLTPGVSDSGLAVRILRRLQAQLPMLEADTAFGDHDIADAARSAREPE